MSTGIVGRAVGMTLVGIQAHIVVIEAVILPGLPHWSMVGLADVAVTEARERLRASFSHVGLRWPHERVTINLSPASLPKTGTALDLGVAVALLAAQGYKPLSQTTVVIGELGLDGTIRPTRGILPSIIAAKEHHFTHAIVPSANADEARLVQGIEIIAVSHISQVAQWMGSDIPVPHSTLVAVNNTEHISHNAYDDDQAVDMADVHGQEAAITGIEVAAAGGHHILMVGPPGVGKSMIAHRLPSILPDLSHDQAVDVAAIDSIQGKHITRLRQRPPIAAPHHTVSTTSLIGGGSAIARPGAVSQAHHGILFCDEFAEFGVRTIQALREPLESGYVEIARSRATVRFPAQFQLVAAANPCACGKILDGPGACTCSSRQLRSYQSKLGGPVRDRIDVVVELIRPTRSDLQISAPSSAQLRSRVMCAREKQYARANMLNSRLPGSWLRKNTALSSTISALLDTKLRTGQLSMRGMDRVLRMAWSVADLAGHDQPSDDDIALAFSLRTALEAS
ncbi:YifB family Mg chelatase-like AAA ATPase [Arcanobacterium pinnipediorum]|uniref:YifB family Mg chelatase-like AAA ATPase n=1 Tax=Arcanobacterium pinnipediorum TaxID=1503041 RepID=A0ABY5AJA6_9ACTO|nr:YifB family Mg chelatase-like AAA ATPase [Arcanobacterium pinnipediorum]USR79935.1 YifB family Mg chelatase-like AAA ATPase [Arcanobacterium pinnipediorum]